MSEISTGTITQSGNTTFVSGTSSGLNTAALIENAVAANNSEADEIDIQVQENDLKIAAYEELYGLAQNIQDSLGSLKSSTSFLDDEKNVFVQRVGDLSSNGAAPTGLIDVGIEEGADLGSYSIVVEQKAEAFSIGSTAITDQSAALGFTGSFTLGIDGFTDEQIDVTATDSLADIAVAINASSATSGVSASILKVSETDYQLIITGTDTNKAMTATTISGDVLQNLGIVDIGDTFEALQIIQNEQGSRILLDGATITRDDNSYDDLINGVTIDIKTADAGTTITLEVDNDIATSKDAILGLIDSYNAYREFVSLNQEVGADGTVPDTAILFSDSILDTLNYAVSSLISGATGDGDAGSLRSLGINFDFNNRLVLDDEAALDNALLNDFDNVANFFSTNVDIDNAQVALISNTSSQEALDFSIDIVTDVGGNIISAQVGGASPFTIDGASLIGNVGTAYEGLTFSYAGTTDTTIAISLSAGLADLLYTGIEGYTNPNGIIQDEIAQYQDENIDFEVEAGEIRARGEEIREDEIQKYAFMEARLATLDSLLNTIRALLGTNDD